jgi:hypothetical protein
MTTGPDPRISTEAGLRRMGDALTVPGPSNFIIQSSLDWYGGCRSASADVGARS